MLTTASRVCRVVELCTNDLPAPTQVFELPVSTRRESKRPPVSSLELKIKQRERTRCRGTAHPNLKEYNRVSLRCTPPLPLLIFAPHVNDVVHRLVVCGHADDSVGRELGTREVGVRARNEVLYAGLVAGEERPRSSEVEALRHRDADEVVAHLHYG